MPRTTNKKKLADAKKALLESQRNGIKFEAKTEGQKDYIRSIVENTVTLCTGPSGAGKTLVASALAGQYLLQGKVDKILMTRPCIETSKRGLGYLPGSLHEKFNPYLIPLVEEMKKSIGIENYNKFINNGQIVVHPLELMRGMNFHNTFMILDEAQNATLDQLIMFITRMGENTKVCINGDIKQTDLNPTIKNEKCDLQYLISKVSNLTGFSHVSLLYADIVRNPLIAQFLQVMNQ